MTEFNENIAQLLDSSGNLRSEVIRDYVLNMLSPTDMHAVERHLLSSPFDADVVDGYKEMAKNKSPEYYVDQVKYEIPRIVGPEKSIQINYKLIAASFVGLVGLFSIGYLVSNLDFNSQSEIATVSESLDSVQEEPIESVSSNEIVVSDTFQNEMELQSDKPTEDIISVNDGAAIPSAALQESKVLVLDPVVEEEEGSVEEGYDNEEVEEEFNELVERDISNNVASSELKEVKTEKVDPYKEMLSYSKNNLESPKVSRKYADKAEKNGFTEASELRGEKSLLDEGGVRFRKKEYADAAKFYDLVLSSNPKQQSALTYGGLSNLYVGNYDKAANQLVLVKKKSDLIKWNLATSYINTGRKESAKAILNDLLLNGSSSYKKKSKQILDSL